MGILKRIGSPRQAKKALADMQSSVKRPKDEVKAQRDQKQAGKTK